MRGGVVWGALAVLLIVCASTQAIAAEAADTTPTRASRALGDPDSAEACLKCHDDPKVTGVLHTPHMSKSDARTHAGDIGCQNCHGDSAAHVARVGADGKRPLPSRVFTGPQAAPVAALNEVCAGCHQGGIAMHWQGSQHANADISCVSCHSAHTVKDAVLTKTTQAPICFTCHADRRADALKPSHHPVLEGRMACSDCHNTHGSVGPNLLRSATVNDTCLTCHDEKRGPFLWEHAPVQEQCTICHTPHGSVQQTLLRQRVPYICQDCHDSSTHNSQPFSGANLPGGPVPGRQLVLRGCLNCHGAVHGSNHPGGARFMR